MKKKVTITLPPIVFPFGEGTAAINDGEEEVSVSINLTTNALYVYTDKGNFILANLPGSSFNFKTLKTLSLSLAKTSEDFD